LIPGPGCRFVFVLKRIFIKPYKIAVHEDVVLLAFGDMLRVPVNVPKAAIRTLEQAQSRRCRHQAHRITKPRRLKSPRLTLKKTVVFFVAGFETTCAPVAAMLAEEFLIILLILMSGRLTWPAVAMLLNFRHTGI